MTLEERKLKIINWITGISNEETLEKIEQVKEDWFENLPEEAQRAVLEAKEQGDQGIFMDPEAQYKKLKDLL